ncbi:MAG: HD-GYP domain-containing protein [Treponema sp.]|nr:HD-GYP domain-containing protein [Treponema sp.]
MIFTNESGLAYNINFEAAAFFFILLLYLYLRKKYYNTSQVNNTFRRLVFFQLWAILFDIASSITISYADRVPLWANIALNTIYFASSACLFYTLHLFFISFGLKKKVGVPLLFFSRGVLISFFALLIANIPTGIFFGFENGRYIHGPFYPLCSILPLVFLWECGGTFFIIKKRVTTQILTVLLTLLVMSALGPVLQYYFFPKVLLTNFFSLVSLILCLFVLVSPDYAELSKKRAELNELQKHLEAKAAMESEKIHKRDKQKELLAEQIIDALAETIDAGDLKRNNHSENVAENARKIAYKMGLSKNEVQQIYYTAILHDIGVIGIAEDVIGKQGKFSPEEFEQIKKHSEIGERILSKITEMPEMAANVRSHHERWDGKGYPDGLVGAEIPLTTRIIAVADAFDAMTHERSYKEAMSVENAKKEILAGAGSQFDPRVAEVAVEVL